VNRLETVLSVVFVLLILWLTWLPLGSFIKDIKKNDFDFWRDVDQIVGSIKNKLATLPGKLALAYILLYIVFSIVNFTFLKT